MKKLGLTLSLLASCTIVSYSAFANYTIGLNVQNNTDNVYSISQMPDGSKHWTSCARLLTTDTIGGHTNKDFKIEINTYGECWGAVSVIYLNMKDIGTKEKPGMGNYKIKVRKLGSTDVTLDTLTADPRVSINYRGNQGLDINSK